MPGKPGFASDIHTSGCLTKLHQFVWMFFFLSEGKEKLFPIRVALFLNKRWILILKCTRSLILSINVWKESSPRKSREPDNLKHEDSDQLGEVCSQPQEA